MTWVAPVDGLDIANYFDMYTLRKILKLSEETKDKISLVWISTVVFWLMFISIGLFGKSELIVLGVGCLATLFIWGKEIRKNLILHNNKQIATKSKVASNDKSSKVKSYPSSGNSQFEETLKTEQFGVVKQRIGQNQFRQSLLMKWDYRCAVTSYDKPEILIASHIIPWKDSDDAHRMNVNNGLLLSPNIDALFDKNLISFEDSGHIIICNTLLFSQYEKLGIHSDMKLRFVNEEMKAFLKIHRQTLLKKDQ